MSSSTKSSESTSFSSGSQDDRALRLYLRQDRNKPPGQTFYDLAREEILLVELAGGRDQAMVINKLTLAFATLLDDLRTPRATISTSKSLWEHFLRYYQAASANTFSVDELKRLRAPYFARDVLLGAIIADKDRVFAALTEAYREPARRMIRLHFKEEAVSFEDAYQEALINLAKKPPAPDKTHTAQLYSIFRTIVYRRALDQLNKAQPSEEMLNSVFPEAEGHNLADYTDYITDDQGLNERFASDDAGEILGKALQLIPATCRDLLRQRFFASLKFKEIAAANGYHTNDVGNKVARCLKKLRQILTSQNGQSHE